MKRAKLVASLMMCVFCLSFLVVGVWAAVSTVNFNLSGQLTFNPEGVYVKVSGQMYRGENYGTLAPLTASNYILPEMTNYDEVDGVPAGNLPLSTWTAPDVTLVPGERAVKYRIEVTNVSEAGIMGEATATITGGAGTANSTTAGGVTTTTYDNLTVTEYAQYIKNIQPNDTQVYELVIELNENATASTVNVSIAFSFTDDKFYTLNWMSGEESFSANFVNIGTYPQRYVGDEMNEILESWYTSQTATKEYTLYKGCTTDHTNHTGTKNDSITIYSYNYIDNNTYARVELTDVYSTENVTYMTGDAVIDETYAWFKVEPIQWRVLTEDYENNDGTFSALLLSELALNANTTFFYNYYGSCSYESSIIREFLVNSLYNEIFSSVEQTKISSFTIPTTTPPYYSISDKICILSNSDYITTYFTSNVQRLCSPSDFAIANYAEMNLESSTYARQNGGTTSYWTSTEYTSHYIPQYAINADGSLSENGIVQSYTYVSVRPAILYNL